MYSGRDSERFGACAVSIRPPDHMLAATAAPPPKQSWNQRWTTPRLRAGGRQRHLGEQHRHQLSTSRLKIFRPSPRPWPRSYGAKARGRTEKLRPARAARQWQQGQTHQRSRAKQVREYLRVWGQPRNVVSTRPEGLASDETAHQEGGRSRLLRDLWDEESCPAAHQNGMGARSCTRIG